MNKFSYMLLAGLTLAAQVVNPLPSGTTASAQVETNGTEVAQSIYTATVVGVEAPKTPDFDIEVVAPLKAKQAEIEAAAQAKITQARAKTITTTKVVGGGSTDAALMGLRQCEAGGNYARNSGNGYYGAYQYNLGTWSNYQGYARPDLAPPEVQDAKVRETQARRGWSPWPACARKLGLM